MVDEYENKGKEAAAIYLLGQSLGTEGMAEIKSFVADEYRKRGYTIREDNI